MTIKTQTNRVQYVGNGVTTEFPVTFPLLQPGHLRLFLWQNNRQTEMTVGFTVIGAGTSSVSVRTTAPIAVGTKLTILREVPLKQEMDLLNGGDFNAEIVEGSADNLEMQIQQLDEKVGRAIVAPESMGSNEVTYETLAGLKEDAEAAAATARSAATTAATDAGRAEYAAGLAEDVAQEIKNLQATATSLAPEVEATAAYNPVTGILALGIPKGHKGEQGTPGRDGSGVNILGVLSNTSELPASGNPGDAYMVMGDLYIWNSSGSDWANAGPIRGPKGEQGEAGDQGATGPQGPKGDGAAVGETRLFSFRPSELPSGWYFANGDQYALASPQGAALNSLSANYKADWGIVINGGNISLPKLFYSDGRGLFLRAVNGTTRQVGNIELDAMQNATGSMTFYPTGSPQEASGVFTRTTLSTNGGSFVAENNKRTQVDFSLANVARTANENRPLNIGMTPAIYLGV